MEQAPDLTLPLIVPILLAEDTGPARLFVCLCSLKIESPGKTVLVGVLDKGGIETTARRHDGIFQDWVFGVPVGARVGDVSYNCLGVRPHTRLVIADNSPVQIAKFDGFDGDLGRGPLARSGLRVPDEAGPPWKILIIGPHKAQCRISQLAPENHYTPGELVRRDPHRAFVVEAERPKTWILSWEGRR